MNNKKYKEIINFLQKSAKRRARTDFKSWRVSTLREDRLTGYVDAFFQALQYRGRSHGHKKSTYSDNYYYITTSSELGCIKSKRGHDKGYDLGKMLERRGIIDKKTHEASIELNGKRDSYFVKGVIVKHNRILEDFGKSLSDKAKKVLSMTFDKLESCNMIIDRDFEKAYEPIYRDSAVYAGDLCSSQSCMSGRGNSAQKFYGAIPCCKVVRFEKDNEQVGRCIMYEWEGRRHFIRIYGIPSFLPKMYKLLKQELKETDIFGRSTSLPNIRCKTEIEDETPNMYLDGRSYGFARHTDEDGNHTYYMTKDGDEYSEEEFDLMKSTSNGYVEDIFDDDGNYVCCDQCGQRIHRDDAEWIDDNCFCSCSCAREYGYSVCDRCDEWFWNEDEDYVYTIDGHSYCCSSCANRDGYYQCDDCREWTQDCNYVEGDNLCDDCLEKNIKDGEIVCCDYCGEYLWEQNANRVKKGDEIVYLCKYCGGDEYEPLEESDEENDKENN